MVVEIVVSDFVFISSFLFGVAGSVWDLKKNIIPNIFPFMAFFINMFILITLDYSIVSILLNIIPITLIGFLLWKLNAWGGGDFKMLIAISPIYVLRNFLSWPSWNVFSAVFFVTLFLFQLFMILIKEETEFPAGIVFPLVVYFWWWI